MIVAELFYTVVSGNGMGTISRPHARFNELAAALEVDQTNWSIAY
jgi:hypothetical protein